MKKMTAEIRIRDPFVYVDQKTKTYYLYGTTDENPWEGKGTGFDYYKSKDLIQWDGPYQAFRPEKCFWGKENFWAPEVWHYRNSYYMLATFTAPGRCRGVQILKTEDLDQPFYPIKNEPITPANWECLDGTLWIDEKDMPWLVFSHEWTQTADGEICCVRLSEDLTSIVSAPRLLFHGSDAPWTVPIKDKMIQGEACYVTDGPFVFQKDGKLQMLWSSAGKEGYATGLAFSKSGEITGPWEQEEEPVYKKDGGHAMIFETFAGQQYLALHAPNSTPDERPAFVLFN